MAGLDDEIGEMRRMAAARLEKQELPQPVAALPQVGHLLADRFAGQGLDTGHDDLVNVAADMHVDGPNAGA